MANERIMEFMLSCKVLEMADIDQQNNVPVDPSIDISAVTAGDTDPKFVNVEVIRAGQSGNKRRYGNAVIDEISTLTPGLQGFLGHPDPSKYGFEFREPQSIWVGSITQTLEDGSKRCIAKCYLFKTSALREWIPASIAAGNPMTVSINGTADVINNGEFLDVLHMTSLDSIDWANPGTEGVVTSQAISVVTELKNNTLGGNSMAEVLSAQEIIKNATVTEFKAFNPTGFNGVINSITVQELQAANPTVYASIQDSARITEMQLSVDGTEKPVKLTEMQGIITAKEVKITELAGEIASLKLTEFKNSEIAKLVPEDYREKISGRVTGNTQEAITASINSEIAYVREMGGLDNAPINRQTRTGDEEIRNAVASMFGVKAAK